MKSYYQNQFCKIYNEDCIQFLNWYNNKNISCVLTSPPYNTGRPCNSEQALKHHWGRYDIYMDEKTQDEYIAWTIELFNLFDKVLIPNGTVLYNISYGSDSSDSTNKDQIGLLWFLLPQIIRHTPFMIADKIVWKKKCALPNNASPNKLTRIVQDVFVFVRKDQYMTFNANKPQSVPSKTGQIFYQNMYNFIQARNNDGSCDLNKATYSSELCQKLLKMYCKKGDLILDPFNGTGTTAIACRNLGMDYIGVQLSVGQCQFSKNRISGIKILKNNDDNKIVQESLF